MPNGKRFFNVNEILSVVREASNSVYITLVISRCAAASERNCTNAKKAVKLIDFESQNALGWEDHPTRKNRCFSAGKISQPPSLTTIPRIHFVFDRHSFTMCQSQCQFSRKH